MDDGTVEKSSPARGSSSDASADEAVPTTLRVGLESTLLLHAVADRMAIAITDLSCLLLLVLDGPATAGRLAERSGLTTGAITGVVDRLVRAGWAGREADPTDRRRVVVRLVDERRGDLDAALAPLRVVTARLWAEVPVTDRAPALAALDVLLAALASEVELLRRPASAEPGRPPQERAVLQLVAWSGPLEVVTADLGTELARAGAGAPVALQARGNRVRVTPAARRSRADGPPAVELHRDVAWEVEVTGGAHRVALDLRHVAVARLGVDGGANRVAFDLPVPSGVVPVLITGGANRVEIRRPAGVAVGLRVGAGAADVRVDGVRLDGARGVGWGDPVLLSAADQPDRYDIQVAGGVARLVVA